MAPDVLSATPAPPNLAAPLSVTVQLVMSPGARDVGPHTFELTANAGSVTIPAVASTETNVPSGAAAMAPPVAITTALEPDTVPAIVAITPLPIALPSEPLAMQV